MMIYSEPKHLGAIVIYFIVNFNVLKKNYYALVGGMKEWISASTLCLVTL
jgi:hypothetical protein